MLELKCKQCTETLTAKDEKALIEDAKVHFKKKHFLLPVTDAQIAENVKKNAKKIA